MRKNKVGILKRKADKLYQIKLIREKPRSVISGKPTEVIHHFVPKGQSNNLRYDYKNGVPLTNAEHFAHHTKGDPSIVVEIVRANGQEWHDDLQARRRTIFKLNIGSLKDVIEWLTLP